MWIITKPINWIHDIAIILNELSKVAFFKSDTALMEVLHEDTPNQELDEFKDELINS